MELPQSFARHLSRYRTIVEDYESFLDYMSRPLKPSIRANTLLLSPSELAKRLERRGLRLKPVQWHPWFFQVEDLGPVEQPGRTIEHLLGYYYVQELSSALPPLVLDPLPGGLILDMAAAPGSKTTQMAQMMENEGTIVANDVSTDRIGALRANLDRLRITNTIITREDGRFLRSAVRYSKILLDAPCSSEGTARRNPAALARLTLAQIRRLSKLQKTLVRRAYELLEPGGLLVYSVCTLAPEEAEEVVDYAIGLGLEPERVRLPVRTAPGITRWSDEKGRVHGYRAGVERSARVWPHLNDTGGMFIAGLRKPGGR